MHEHLSLYYLLAVWAVVYGIHRLWRRLFPLRIRPDTEVKPQQRKKHDDGFTPEQRKIYYEQWNEWGRYIHGTMTPEERKQYEETHPNPHCFHLAGKIVGTDKTIFDE